MITNAIQSILSPLINSFSPVVESDKIPDGLFCVHNESITDHLRDKEGEYGRIYDLSITLVGDSIAEIDDMVDEITDTLEATEGTIENALIDEIILKSTMGTTWDDEKKKYYNTINFSVETQNL